MDLLLLREEVQKENLFSPQGSWERWNVDKTVARVWDPEVQPEESGVAKLTLPDPESKLGVCGFVSRKAFHNSQGNLKTTAEFRPLKSGLTGEHFGIFGRIHNCRDARRGQRFGLALQDSSRPSGQCQGTGAFMQFTGYHNATAQVEHQFFCFELAENPFSEGLNKRYRVEFEESRSSEELIWRGSLYRRTLLGWRLRGELRVRQTMLSVHLPPLPAQLGAALGPGYCMSLALESFKAQVSGGED